MTEPVEVSVLIDARPSTIFPFLVDPEKIVEWMGTAAKLDPRPGGVFHVDVHSQAIASGEFVEVVPDKRVVFTFGWENNDGVPPGTTTVEIELTPQGERTEVHLRHSNLPDENACREHTAGWEYHLQRLVAVF
jgi:uncharacterized protein YndB with AHSA1/START domain